MKRDHILITGTGALATLFAARLSSVGLRVFILGTWIATLESFRRNGAQIEGKPAERVDIVSHQQKYPPFSQGLVLVKSGQTDKVANDLLMYLAEDGVILTLQNGLGNREKLIAVLGDERVASGVTTIGARMLTPGVVRITGKDTIWIERHPRISMIVNMLRCGGFTIHMVNDIKPFLWKKLIINCAINPISGILRVKNGNLREDPLAWKVVERVVEEVVNVARAENIHLGIRNPLKLVEKVTRQTRDNYSSMLQDILRGVPTEIDALNGEIILLGENHYLDMHVNRLVFELISEGKQLSSLQLLKIIN